MTARFNRTLNEQLTGPHIIIGGCGRSGTSLLLSILSACEDIVAVPNETHAYCPGAYSQIPEVYEKRPFEPARLYEALLQQEISPKQTRWCEKTPKNVLSYQKILNHFGDNVRIINIVRDGRDVITSVHPLDPNKFHVSPERWVKDVSAGLELKEHPQVLTIRYEDLVGKFPVVIEQVCEFIGEEFGERILDWPNYATMRVSKGWFEGLRNVGSGSVGRWKKPEYRDRIDQFVGDSKANALLKRYHYLD